MKNVEQKALQVAEDEVLQAPTSWSCTLRFMVVMAVLLGLVYPLITTAVGGWLFPEQAGGSMIRDSSGRVIGSNLVAQIFVSDGYFIGRPSAAGNDAGSVSGSNLAPSNGALRERAETDAQAIAQREGVSVDQIPIDLITASGSGIDPHISPEAARLQVTRVAQARQIDEASVTALLDPALDNVGWLGSPVINVLRLNASLDERYPVTPGADSAAGTGDIPLNTVE
ncbi:Potassium-transporting ATPase C chain [Halomonas citrativorans]|uniref:Potassium-transporting ATPase KdpC subunit n=1 Tax=Halomonas citrativorans TaxID=2742612 RepID=A0A1R4I563_9GAMM|nr:potassium-transporting ATPase subunit KdpC [Halomonas citrativorans]SJN14952.1 Potassium-transporting ATPase C chain [Halomonas citrativorans]